MQSQCNLGCILIARQDIMSADPTIQFITALKGAVSVDTDAELAQVLNIGKSTIASWRRRGDIPKKIKNFAKEKFNIDHEKISKIAEQGAEKLDELSETGFYLAILRLGHHLPEEDLLEFALWLGSHPHELWSFVHEPEVFDRGVYQEPEAVSDWFARIVSKKHATPEQIIALKRKRRSQAR